MRIAFVYPSYVRHAEANPELAHLGVGGYLGSPSLSIALLAALTPNRHEVAFYDDRIEDIPFDEPFDLVALPVFTPAAMRAIEIAQAFRLRGVLVVAGGVFASLLPEALAPHVDAVCVGEGEPVWRRIVADAERGSLRPLYRVDEPYDLTLLPPPRLDLYTAKEGPGGYRASGDPDEFQVDYPLQLSRGCPLSCVACAVPGYLGRRMRFASPTWVRGVFDALAGLDGHRRVSLTEDTSSFPTRSISAQVAAALDGCAESGVSVSYVGASPAQCLKAEPGWWALLRTLRTTSIYMVFGFDPASRGAFAATPTPGALQSCLDAVRRVRDEGVGVYASLLVGHDEEDESVFDRILDFADRAQIDTAEFVMLTPYPGTPLFRRLVEEDRLITRDWSLYNDANPTFRPRGYSAERMRAGYLHLWTQFYARRDAAHRVQI